MAPSRFFSPQNPFDAGYLDVAHGHRLWYAQYGNPDGIPLMWLHGGPGSGSSPRHQIFVNPKRYRLVLCDQRGCGRSTPAGAIAGNDTEQLVQDIETMRLHLCIGKVLLGGGSWGACLALAYAQHWRQSLLGLVLRAPFIAGKGDIDRFFQPETNAAGNAWKTFAAHVPQSDRGQLLHYLACELATDTPYAATLAQAWDRYQQQQDQPDAKAMVTVEASDIVALQMRYRIQLHFLVNNLFLDEQALLHAASQLSGLPVALLQGANDRVCDPANALRLHELIEASRLHIVADAGHDPFHSGMATALQDALDSFAEHGHFDHWGTRHA
ncbi:MAG: alpha/beta fold hydrolase [Herminiimonas sp.]|nr:alpha/beta fold hydrolase [Herminiimonas sp.]